VHALVPRPKLAEPGHKGGCRLSVQIVTKNKVLVRGRAGRAGRVGIKSLGWERPGGSTLMSTFQQYAVFSIGMNVACGVGMNGVCRRSLIGIKGTIRPYLSHSSSGCVWHSGRKVERSDCPRSPYRPSPQCDDKRPAFTACGLSGRRNQPICPSSQSLKVPRVVAIKRAVQCCSYGEIFA